MPINFPNEISLTHLSAMMGPLGLYQHAKFSNPRLEEGYCTDDNARAAQFFLECEQNKSVKLSNNITPYLDCCWEYIVAAQTPAGLFRNFRSCQGHWLDRNINEDTQARVTLALATVITTNNHYHARQRQAEVMLQRLLPHLKLLSHPRSIAEAINALAIIDGRNDVKNILHFLWHKLWQRWQQNSTSIWPWPYEQLTYANALLPHGLLAGAIALNHMNNDVRKAIDNSVSFLIDITHENDCFIPVGNAGWYQKGSQPARYDQQPIEAHTMFDLLQTYHRLTNTTLPSAVLTAPYEWFWGRNCQSALLVDTTSGACYDGLTPQGVNQNQGAESLLAYLRSELLMLK